MERIVDIQQIRRARLNKGYSQAALAKASGLSLLTVNLIEAKKTKFPQPMTVKKICDALELSVSDIYIEAQ